MELSEVTVVTYTSSLTLAIAGIFKEVFQLILAVEWNGDEMTPLNIVGLFICLLGISCHVVHKIKTQPIRLPERSYDKEVEHNELGEYLIDEHLRFDTASESDGEKSDRSDTQVLFDLLNRHER
ncbi:hypothetical protein NQ317_000496 [Molorchus minor]|uniref:EamA domain-containing protein n=1 Tax=Molorchus minor TaxID=1323400 RepID=A0ABQ9JC84_9CUCU|nr:hypothetical protein NQ317_000496 [Molorchus minor]